MKITYALKIGCRGVLTVSVDQELWREIHTTIFGKKPQFPENESMASLEEVFFKLEYAGAMRATLNSISMRARLSSDVRETLKRQLVTEATIEKVISECRQLGYLQDEQWIESFVRGQLSKKSGPQAILHKLMQKKVPYDTAKEVLERFDDTEGQKERISRLLDTRYRNKDLSDFHAREKVVGSLHRKGFSVSLIKQTINERILDIL